LARARSRPAIRSARRAGRNIDEEETGHYSFGVSHPELFLPMMDGLGIARADVAAGPIEPEAIRYRACSIATALATLVRGRRGGHDLRRKGVHERREFEGRGERNRSTTSSRGTHGALRMPMTMRLTARTAVGGPSATRGECSPRLTVRPPT
jgi:hypothetical protein